MGIVQGLTEFLPISSSGHLILVPYLLGWNDPFITSLAFSVMLHVGHAGRAARLLPGRLAAARAGRVRRRSATARSGAIRTGGWRGCSSRRRSRPRSPGSCSTTSSRRRSASSGSSRVTLVVGGDRPVAGRPLGRPDQGRRGRHVPGRDRDRRRPGARARPGHQPVRDHDLGRPASPGWTARRPPGSAS